MATRYEMATLAMTNALNAIPHDSTRSSNVGTVTIARKYLHEDGMKKWIAQFADRVLALKEGRIFLDGTPSEVLTSPLLQENGFGISRYTSVARRAKGIGLWNQEKLPVTLDEAVEGFISARPSGEAGGPNAH